MNIIGLGSAGCAIAKKFAKYPQYKTYMIDAGIEGAKKDGVFALPFQKTPEEYESLSPSFNSFFKNTSGPSYLFVAGSGDVSACSLRLIESLKRCDVSVVYIRPDISLLSGKKKMMENLVYNVFQQYARSAKFTRLYILTNPDIEAIIGDIPIVSYYDTINEFIVNTFHMINVYDHSEPVQSNMFASDEISRICTVGIYDIDKSEEKMFFPLDMIKYKRYIYAINKDTLESDGKLFRKITEQTKSMISEQNIDINFQIFSTDYDHNYGYVIANSHIIQGPLK